MNAVAACLLTVAALGGATAKQAQAAPRYAAMVVDGHTGKILYSRNGDAKRFPASLTKIMTLYLLFDFMEAGKIQPGTWLTVTPNAASQPPSKLGLKAGQKIRVRDAIRSLVTKSANDVAVTVAENIGGTEKNFAKMMTAKARKIGMRRTTFKNASGLPNKDQVTTARDMITMANRLMFDHPEKYGYFKRKYFKYKGKKYRNHNRLLFDYKGTDGIKTGYTRASGFNLLANVRRGNKHLIAVIFGGKSSKRRNTAMRSILNKALPRATAQLPRKNRPPRKKPVQYASTLTFPLEASTSATPANLKTRAPAPQADQETVASIPAQPQASRPPVRDGKFHIQVGAYSRQTDAMQRLAAIQLKAGDVINGHAPLAVPLVEPKRYLYRARFAGFTRKAAKSTCSQLKRRAITCVVMSAE
ncbi:D-alanyl-D-alanine carboxypeptidase DacF precursor [bacterium BMS3Bbin10]|nr:D-alanyl-D-alanine carboxypeptidase DacF precursor [bacterium BMS3Bbin10]